MSDVSPEAIIAEATAGKLSELLDWEEGWEQPPGEIVDSPTLVIGVMAEKVAAHVVERLRHHGHTIVPTPTVEWFILKGGFFRQRGRIYSGPYVDREDAFRARNTIERIEDTHEYFIDSRPLAATASTAPEES